MVLRKKIMSMSVIQCEKYEKIYKEICIEAEDFSVVKPSDWNVFKLKWKSEFQWQIKIWTLRH